MRPAFDVKYSRACIVLFARAPVAGQVKTRLISAIGEDGALTLHKELLARQIGVLNDSTLCERQLWVDSQPDHPDFLQFAGPRMVQHGADLGEKMLFAARQLLADFNAVVIIGSDCPGIDEAYLDQALALLTAGTDVVLGPADDGGYVLIGLRRADAAVFQDIDWGSATVLEQTRVRLKASGLRWRELAPLFDIDRPEDLEKLL